MRNHPFIRDGFSVIFFVICVVIGTIFVNSFIFRSFTVEGPSMEPTLYTGDRLLVSRIGITLSQLRNEQYQPNRGDVIVFKNPNFDPITERNEYIVKRVIGLPGETVTVSDGTLKVYNESHPDGFEPDPTFDDAPGSPTSGDSTVRVLRDTVYVAGDHREDNFSYDSRNGLGLVPLYDVIGPVALRIYPFNEARTF